MYLAMILLLMAVLPAGSVLIERLSVPESALLPLIGKWLVFWAVGWRLLLAGAKQVRDPRFTARDIFGIADPAAGRLVAEIGYGNLAIGAIGVASLWRPGWTAPAAVAGCIFLGLAGLGHLRAGRRNAKETIAMVSDLGVAAVLALYLFGRFL
jgi:hypothetical protein